MLEQRKEEEEAWHWQKKLLLEAEEQRRAMMEAKETKLTDQRTKHMTGSTSTVVLL